ncbi:MAG: hypothetical protein ACREM2_12555, partial [Vulcanimicrobiaceae bacterium]
RRRLYAIWCMRSLLSVVVLLAVAYADPRMTTVGAGLAFGARALALGAIPTTLGAAVYSAPHAFSGALGWLGAVIGTELYRSLAGFGGLTFATGLTVVATLALVELRARLRTGPLLAVGAAILATLCFLDGLCVGGGASNWLVAAALLYVLEGPGFGAVLAASALTILWCNLSPQGILAPVLALAVALGATIDRRPLAVRRWAWFAVGGTALALFATPAGVAYPRLALGDLELFAGSHALLAHAPLLLAPGGFHIGVVALLSLGFVLGARRGRTADALLFAFGLILALADGTFVPLFGIAAAPALADAARTKLPALVSVAPGQRLADATVMLVSVALAAVLAIDANARDIALEPSAFAPYDLVEGLAADAHPHRLWCADLQVCSAAEAFAGPNLRVYADARVAALPPAVRDQQRAIVAMRPDWPSRLRATGADALLVPAPSPLATLLTLEPGWHATAGDAGYLLYRRTARPPRFQ